MNAYLSLTEEVEAAVAQGRPLVALESTIISHGMPYPSNIAMAEKVQAIIREEGAVPATVALMDGRIKIGLSKGELERLATEKSVAKVSRRDFASVLMRRELGATTVASTMIAAQMAGIKFFVTGGIGGVHRGYEATMDVSADLEELSKTAVTVICAGAKAILDLPRTLEYLETHGVPVLGYRTRDLPAFFSESSGLALQDWAESPDEVARLVKTKEGLGLGGGLLVVNPIPHEHALESAFINAVIEEALADAAAEKITGKAVTPYLLARIVEKTGGRSLQANLHLVYNNARVGAQIAAAYASL